MSEPGKLRTDAARPATSTPVAYPPPTGITGLQEQFARAYVEHGNASRAYRECVGASGKTSGTVIVEAHRLKHTPAVAARIAELRRAVAEGTVVSVRQQLVDLAEMAAVDTSEIERIVHTACPACLKLYDADLIAMRPLPDLTHDLPPHPDCTDSKAHTRVEITPMAEWSPAARKLYDGVDIAKDGTLRPVFRNRNQIVDMIAKMLGAYVSRSENITAHVTVDPSKPNPWSAGAATPEQILHRIRRSRGEPVTIDQPAEPEASP